MAMDMEIWVGFVEVRQLPGVDHKVMLSGKGAFTWITCWATNIASYEEKVSEVMNYYGLFVVEMEKVMPFANAEEKGLVDDELAEQFEDTSKDNNFCIFGTLHNYMGDT
jgi:hypothetical protein